MNSKVKDTLRRSFNIPQLDKIENLVKSFNLTETILFWFFIALLALSVLISLAKINSHFTIEVPAKGGDITEGMIGSPRFINPLLSISNTDKDMTMLVYSGLMKATPDGQLITDLAKEYSISEDGLVYTFILKDDLYFHDNKPVTTDDIEYTIRLTQDSVIKSFKRANWDGVRVEKINDKEIRFILKAPYSPFLENTTIGILPKHIWEKIGPEQFAFSKFNIEPIGTGPYKITDIEQNSSGIFESYELKAFSKYALNEPYITHFTIRFYPNEDSMLTAFGKNEIENMNSISPEKAKILENGGLEVITAPLPRIFGVFFNQNENLVFTNEEVREALNVSIDRDRIIEEVLSGYGVAIGGPIPPTSSFFDKKNSGYSYNQEKAMGLLEENGWEMNEDGYREKVVKKQTTPLAFTISTSDAPELKATAEIIKENWEKIGAKVTINIYESGDLNQNVIRPREYDALLFGEIVGRDMDLFAFWHSSQRNDPGLNIALYTNITTDKLLDDARKTHDQDVLTAKYKKFQEEIASDVPATFIYSPEFIYIIPEEIRNVSLGQITLPSERFLGVQDWYIKSDKVWEIFKNQN